MADPPPRTPATAGVVQSCHELLTWLIPRLDDWPRSRRFTLGAYLEQGELGLLRLLVEAACAQGKDPLLRLAKLDMEVLPVCGVPPTNCGSSASAPINRGGRLMMTLACGSPSPPAWGSVPGMGRS